MGRKTTLVLRLCSTYYTFAYKKYICEKFWMRSRFGLAVGIFVYIVFSHIVFSHLLDRNLIKYSLDAFYNCRGHKHRFNSAQKCKRYGKYQATHSVF